MFVSWEALRVVKHRLASFYFWENAFAVSEIPNECAVISFHILRKKSLKQKDRHVYNVIHGNASDSVKHTDFVTQCCGTTAEHYKHSSGFIPLL